MEEEHRWEAPSSILSMMRSTAFFFALFCGKLKLLQQYPAGEGSLEAPFKRLDESQLASCH
jgi:hypothetical protein